MNVDVIQLVKKSMQKMGCGDAIAGELDLQAPVRISFHSLPAMFVESVDEQVTLWSQLEYAGEHQLARCAFDLLVFQLPSTSDAFASRRPLLSVIDGKLILHARVEPSHLSEIDTFTEVLELFYAHLYAVYEILSR